MIKSVIILLLSVHLFVGMGDQPYKKIIHNTDPDAVCLDGSSPGLYVHQGPQKDKILIVLSGGGYCQGDSLSKTLQECYKRSKTQLGSSKYLADELIGPGILSTGPENMMANWTKIFVTYCDGSIFQGHRSQPVKYKDASLYFRGSKLMKANLKYIDLKYNLTAASKIVFSGFSAGGIGVTLWTDYLRSMLNEPSVLYTVVDSGIFMNAESFLKKSSVFGNQLRLLTQLANLEEKSPSSFCNIANVGQQWKCLLLQYNYHYLQGRFLFINSEYDSWALAQILQMQCIEQGQSGISLKKCGSSQMQAIQSYRYSYEQLIYKIMQISNNYSFWSISCSWHVYTLFDPQYNSQINKVPEHTGLTPKKSIELFVFEDVKIINKDKVAWPNNSPCSS